MRLGTLPIDRVISASAGTPRPPWFRSVVLGDTVLHEGAPRCVSAVLTISGILDGIPFRRFGMSLLYGVPYLLVHEGEPPSWSLVDVRLVIPVPPPEQAAAGTPCR